MRLDQLVKAKHVLAGKTGLTRQQEIYHALRSVAWAVWYDKDRDETIRDSSVGHHWHFSANSSEEQFQLLNKLEGECYNAFSKEMMNADRSPISREEEVMYLWFMSLVIEDGLLTTERTWSEQP